MSVASSFKKRAGRLAPRLIAHEASKQRLLTFLDAFGQRSDVQSIDEGFAPIHQVLKDGSVSLVWQSDKGTARMVFRRHMDLPIEYWFTDRAKLGENREDLSFQEALDLAARLCRYQIL